MGTSTLILEHVLTLYEQNKGIRASDYPFTIVRIKFDSVGKALTGEVIPAAKISVTDDGLFDVQLNREIQRRLSTSSA